MEMRIWAFRKAPLERREHAFIRVITPFEKAFYAFNVIIQ